MSDIGSWCKSIKMMNVDRTIHKFRLGRPELAASGSAQEGRQCSRATWQLHEIRTHYTVIINIKDLHGRPSLGPNLLNILRAHRKNAACCHLVNFLYLSFSSIVIIFSMIHPFSSCPILAGLPDKLENLNWKISSLKV